MNAPRANYLKGVALFAAMAAVSAVAQGAGQLPAPGNLRASDFTTTSLSLAADEVPGASGYAFKLERLDGVPETVIREDFAAATNLSAFGWTLSSSNAKLDAYTSQNYYDPYTGDQRALKIDKQSSAGDVTVEIETPVYEAAIRDCSFFCRVGTAGRSDVFRVMGRTDPSSAWAVLHEFVPASGGRTNVTVSVDAAENFRQVKFVFAAAATNFSTAAWDSLAVVYGGDETRTMVESGATVLAAPQFSTNSLPTARYAFQVRALGGEGQQDSPWSDEQVVDLSWAGISVSAPSGVAVTSSGGGLHVSWNAVESAAWYLVTVVPSGNPSSPVVVDLQTTATSCDVAVPSLGEYSATVTAVSPGGTSSAMSAPATGQVTLGAVGAVSAEAVDHSTISASWPPVPLSEGYRVRLFEFSGDVETDSPVYPDGFADDAEWGGGWTSYGVYDTYSGPFPKINHSGSWITTKAYEKPVTAVSFRITNHSSNDEIAEATRLTVSTSPSAYGDDWTARFATNGTASAQLAFAASDGVRRVRFAFTLELPGLDKSPLAEFGRVTVTCGEETRTVAAVSNVTETAATFSGLDPASRYAVEVAPLPGGGDGLASISDPVDLSTVHFRLTGAVPLRGKAFEERFSSLTNMTGDTAVKDVYLDYWQFLRDSEEPEKLLFTSTTNRTTGGVYAFCDTDGTVDSFALGSLATGDHGCAIGIAFVNDGKTDVNGAVTLSFDSIQRSFRSNAATYVLEWKVANGGETDIGSEGSWNAVTIPPTAPYVASDADRPLAEYRQSVSVGIALDNGLEPGRVLVLRWRHPRGASGPMMAIDNVRLDFTRKPQATCITIR